jgi:M6 family metalloprotease-like protein
VRRSFRYTALFVLLFVVVISYWRSRSPFVSAGAARADSPGGAPAQNAEPARTGPGPAVVTAEAPHGFDPEGRRRELLERFAYAQGWAAPQPAAMTAFREWTDRYRTAKTAVDRGAIEAEGVTLAHARRAELRRMIERDPERALQATVPAVIRQMLPAAVLAELETRVAGTGDYMLVGRSFAEAAPTTAAYVRAAVIDGVRYEAHAYGRREAQLSKEGAPLHGIALEGQLAIHESALRVLEPGEIPPAASEPVCLVSGVAVAPLVANAGVNVSSLDVVEVGSRIIQFCSGEGMLETLAERLEAAEAGSTPRVTQLTAGDPSGGGRTIAAETALPQAIGTKRVLVIRVDFPDFPGDPISVGTAQAVMDEVKPFFEAMSYGQTTLVSTIAASTYRMPQNGATYAINDAEDQMHTDARTAAGADYDVASYDRVIVVFRSLSPSVVAGSKITFGGEALISGSRIWINGGQSFSFATVAHELGHTYGLKHANLWRVTDGNPVSPQGASIEYGDPFDDMGSTSVTGGVRDTRHHFNHWAKNRLGWMPDSAVTSVTTSGTYRIHRFDSALSATTQPMALRIFRDGVRSYWVGLRANFSSGTLTANDAVVLWGYNNLQQSQLLDLNTTGTNANDAALAVGSAFTDAAYGITIKPVARGGAEPDVWLDVEVTVPSAPPDVVQAWGRNGAFFFNGANGLTTPEPETYVPMGLTNVRSVVAGDLHAMALKADGTVVAWGDNTYGQTTLPSDLGSVVQVVAGKNVSGAVRSDGTIKLWGDTTSPVITALPASVTNIKALALGYDHALALKRDGTVIAWGGNASRQIEVPAGLANVMTIIAGDRTSVALKMDGTVVKWGVTFSVAFPTGLSGVTALACNGGHVLALKSDGTVVAWGNNANQQCIVPAGLNGVIGVAAGGFHSLAVKSDGSVVGWGSNSQNQASAPPALAQGYAIVASLRASFGLVGPRVYVTAQPQSATVAAGASASLNVAAAGGTTQWLRNGTAVSGATNSSLTLANLQPGDAGIYTARLTINGVIGSSLPAVLGIASTAKVIGSGSEVGTNITHANGNVYDQVLLQGAAASVAADPGQVLRISYLDLQDDIVQVEFAGPGTLSLVLDAVTGPAAPLKYNQPAVSYMKGHAGIVITGATEDTNVSVFSVGRANAVNQALFRDDVTYDGFADIAFIAISSANGKFGGLRTANTTYFATKGITGVYAPGVQFTGPVFVGDISAADAATPTLLLGGGSDVRILGGDLLQGNGRAIQVSGLAQLKFGDGSSSHGNLLPAQANKGRLEQNGTDITTQVVVNP